MSDDNNDTVQQIKNYLTSYGHLVALLAIFVFGVYTRIQGVQSLRQSGEWIFTGNDAWYHFRATMYTVNNYPTLIGFDPMTGYPEGSVNGTFGTLFDLIHATVAMIIGLGSPSEDLVRTVLIYSPPVTMGLIILLVYGTTKFMTDSNLAGLVSAFFVSIFPGTLYRRTLVGFSEHHAMEAFLMILTVFTVLRALKVGEEQFVSWDLIKDRDMEALMPWIKSVGIATFSILLYFLTWPPSVVLFAIFGVATVLYVLIGYNEGRAIESTIVTFGVLSLSMFVMVLLRTPELEFSLGVPSLLHAGVTFATFLGVVLVGLLNRYGQKNEWSVSQVFGVMIGFGIVGTGAVALVAPEYITSLFNLILRVLGNPFGIGTESVLTIAEEQPTSIISLVVGQYGLLLVASMVGISALLYDSLKRAADDKSFSHNIFLFVFSIFMLIISVRTVRYNYYLALFVAVTAAYATYRLLPYIASVFYSLVDYVAVPSDPAKINVTHFGRGAVAGTIGAIMLSILILSVALFTLVPLSTSVSPVYQDSVAVGGYTQWEEPLEWMSENTTDDSIERYGSYNEGTFEYSDEDYGVMSWWDYGHWITVTADRVPIANPFQQNAILASEYMLSQTPEDAEETVESESENANPPKYVAIDWQTANPISKHGAMVSFNENYNSSDMYEQYYTQNSQGQIRLAFYQKKQPFYESMVTRLFYGHGSAMEPSSYTANYTVETSRRTGESFRVLRDGNSVGKQSTVEEANSLGESPTTISGGIGYTNPPEERVSALEQYRLVTSSSSPYYQTLGNQVLRGGFGQRPLFEYANLIQSMSNETIAQSQPEELIGENPSTVKIFERVNGANVEGTAEPDSTYTARVQMNDPNTNSTFTYRQRVTTDSDGNYEFTVPYSTSDYDDVEHPPEVRANSSYELVDNDGNTVQTFEVPESAVIEQDNSTVQVQESN